MQLSFSVKANLFGLERIIENCTVVTPQIVAEAGLEVSGYAKVFAPFDTSYLKNTIDSTMISDTTARIQSNADYDVYQELGTYKMAAHPFLSPALEQVALKFMSPQTWTPLIYGGYITGSYMGISD
ncbi:MAG: hypothetical protein WC554_00280 [Clostridia bacterium]